MVWVAPSSAARASRSGAMSTTMSRPQPVRLQRLHQRQADHPRAHHHDRIIQRGRRAADRVQGNANGSTSAACSNASPSGSR